jgi:hypothetical protein
MATVDVHASSSPALFGADVEPKLLRMLRVLYPHDRFPDGPYARTRDAIVREAASDRRLLGMLLQGVRDLDALSERAFLDLDEIAATATLRRLEPTPFFQRVRELACRHFYDDPEVRDLLGYEGPSVHLGGYVDRGFDDLAWLPEPPI